MNKRRTFYVLLSGIFFNENHTKKNSSSSNNNKKNNSKNKNSRVQLFVLLFKHLHKKKKFGRISLIERHWTNYEENHKVVVQLPLYLNQLNLLNNLLLFHHLNQDEIYQVTKQEEKMNKF